MIKMVKVICKKCKTIGYTASPDSVKCQCGGHLKEAGEPGKKVNIMRRFFLNRI